LSAAGESYEPRNDNIENITICPTSSHFNTAPRLRTEQ
jgi:hypothetical protein